MLCDVCPPAKRAKHRAEPCQRDLEIHVAFARAEAARYKALSQAAVDHCRRLHEQVKALERQNRALENRVPAMAIRAVESSLF